ncbi:apovitellenin-1-like [Bufo bufo]|uniref:apovitellenin-1-like n=1 Tax=Bufo bufo TaxID=8384 RepID=UPI001ABE1BC4|nr:apovitellenin-1-like [Bufo bufo]
MRLQIITATCFLLLLSYGVDGKGISKRHVRNDWLIIPDAVAFSIYQYVNDISPESGKALMELFEKPLVQEIRGYLLKTTSHLNLKAQEIYQKITEFLQKTQ